METSDPAIHAVGECTEHRGQTFGLVAPLIEQGKALAAAITGNPGDAFTGAAPATKLKIMGVDIFSAGCIDDSEPGVETVRYEDPGLGIYKKLLLKDNRLRGVILVGDTSDERRYMDWLRQDTNLAPHRRHLLFPPPAADTGLEIAEMPDSEVICGCKRRQQRYDYRGHSPAPDRDAGRTEGRARAPPPVAEAAPGYASNCCARWCPNFRRRPELRCAPACRSPTSSFAKSCAGSS